jgi:hypothetical protein
MAVGLRIGTVEHRSAHLEQLSNPTLSAFALGTSLTSEWKDHPKPFAHCLASTDNAKVTARAWGELAPRAAGFSSDPEQNDGSGSTRPEAGRQTLPLAALKVTRG